jgi:hypothetical protein
MSPLSRRGLLAGAAALALVACSRTADPLVTPTASPTGSVRSQLDAVMEVYARNTDLLGVSIRDRRTGAAYAFRGDFDTQSASIAKVMISLLALNKARAAGEELPFERYTADQQGDRELRQRLRRRVVGVGSAAATSTPGWRWGWDCRTRTPIPAARSGPGRTPPPTISACSSTCWSREPRPSPRRTASISWT